MPSVVKKLTPAILGVAAFSFFISLLMLTVPIFTLQVYDRVLSSRNEVTLLMLTLVAIGLLFAAGFLDAVRNRFLVRIGAAFDKETSAPAFVAALKSRWVNSGSPDAAGAMQDVGIIRNLFSSPAFATLFDLPWIPLFLILLFLFHPILGGTALAGALILAGLGFLSEVVARKSTESSRSLAGSAEAIVHQANRDAEVVQAMGLHRNLLRKWQVPHFASLGYQVSASESRSTTTAVAKTFRQILQVAMLGIGAYLAIGGVISPGIMIASSIIMGRALAPIEGVISAWRNVDAALAAYRRLTQVLEAFPVDTEAMALPEPQGHLKVENVMASVPGKSLPVLHGVTFELQPGEALGILGRTAAGKSTLARLLIGVMAPRGGYVRFDGTDISRWDRDDLGEHIGYLPENPGTLEGTVAQCIARFGEVDSDKVVAAARAANIYELIQSLPDGFDTDLSKNEHLLSGGQRQRIAFARALYGNPRLVVLDEPNSNVDFEGDRALINAVNELKAHGVTTVIVSHRQSILACVDKLLLLENGTVEMFGPRDRVIAEISPRRTLPGQSRLASA